MVDDSSLWRNLDVGFHHGRNYRFKEEFLKKWLRSMPESSDSSVSANDSLASLTKRDIHIRFSSPDADDLCQTIKTFVRLGRDRISSFSVDFRGWGSHEDVESVVSSIPWLTEPASSLAKLEIICNPEMASSINAIDFVDQLFRVTCSERTAGNPCLALRG